MFFLIIFLFSIFITLGVGVLAGWSDFRTLTIPNMYGVVVVLAFVVAYLAAYLAGQTAIFGSLVSHILSAFLVFVVTLCMFALKILGAGDSKFASACALWLPAGLLPVFLFFMTLGGAVLGAFALYVQRKKPYENPIKGGWIDLIQSGESKIPYGMAITFGTVVAFIYAGYFSSGVMSLFLVSAPAS